MAVYRAVKAHGSNHVFPVSARQSGVVLLLEGPL